MVPRVRLEGSEFKSQQMQEIFLRSKTFRMARKPTQPPTEWIPAVKQSKHEADHSAPSTSRLWMNETIPLLSLYAFMASIGQKSLSLSLFVPISVLYSLPSVSSNLTSSNTTQHTEHWETNRPAKFEIPGTSIFHIFHTKIAWYS